MTCRISIVLAIAVAMIVSPSAADTIGFVGTVGTPPADFEFARTGNGERGTWRLVSDDVAGGGFVLEQQSNDPTDFRFPLAIYQKVSTKNVDVRVRIKAISGKVDRAGGIAVRLTSANDYYVVRANALEDNVRFYRVVRGNREQLATSDVKVPANEWHTLGLTAEGSRFTVSFNNRVLYTVTDTTFSGDGKTALWTKADSVTRFGPLDVTVLK